MPVESGHNYDIEIAKDLVKVWDMDKGEFIPIMQLPEDCSVQNELVQDFGRVIFVKIPLILLFFFFGFIAQFKGDWFLQQICDEIQIDARFPFDFDGTEPMRLITVQTYFRK
jgi:hypothetical protein